MKKILLALLIIACPIFSYADEIYYSKPPLGSLVNWSVPESRGAVGIWLMNEGGGQSFINLAQNTVATSSNTRRLAQDINFNGTTSLINVPIQGIGSFCTGNNDSFPLSIVTNFLARTEGENEQGTIIRRGLDVGRWVLFFAVAQINQLRFFKDATTDVSYRTTINLNQRYFCVTTFTGTDTIGNVHIYLDAKEVTYDNATDGATLSQVASTDGISIGAVSDGTNTWDGLIRYLYLYNRVLSLSEIKSTNIAPYKIIKNNYRNSTYAATMGTAATTRGQLIMING